MTHARACNVSVLYVVKSTGTARPAAHRAARRARCVLKDAAARLETIKAAAAQAAERDTARVEQPVDRASQHDSEPKDDPDRVVTLTEAARLSSLSTYTLRRRHRDKFIRLSAGRLGMRRRDALMLSG